MDKQEHQIPPPPVDAIRRRLTQGALAAPVVLATLASENALASVPFNCTISGKVSGNLSGHGTEGDCTLLGLTPGYWRQSQHFGDWHYIPGSGMIDGSFKPINCPTPDGSKQSAEGTLFTTPGFVNVFRCSCGGTCGTSATIYVKGDASFPSTGNATLLQVVSNGGNAQGLVALGRAAVAALLNAYRFAPNFPLTGPQVVGMFNEVCNTGFFNFNATTSWTADQVKAYFESLTH